MSQDGVLKKAEASLANGEYRECLLSLKSLLRKESLLSEKGAQIGTLMITALIGQGETQQAISICKELSNHKNDSIRQQAKQLISILNSPKLERPQEWSVKIPKLNIDDKSTTIQRYTRKKEKKYTKAPPTGTSKNLKPGFTILSLIIFLLLTILLSGCVQFTTQIDITGADRIQIAWDIKSNSNKPLLWQKKFRSSIQELQPKIIIETNGIGEQSLRTHSLTSKEANNLLSDTIAIASNIAGIQTPLSKISLKEKNWLIGIQQNFDLDIDLRGLPEIPGLELAILIDNQTTRSIPKSKPLETTLINDYFNWKLQLGAANNLSLNKWHWSQLGIGSLLVLLIMALSMALQNLKLRMGLGFPELPP